MKVYYPWLLFAPTALISLRSNPPQVSEKQCLGTNAALLATPPSPLFPLFFRRNVACGSALKTRLAHPPAPFSPLPSPVLASATSVSPGTGFLSCNRFFFLPPPCTPQKELYSVPGVAFYDVFPIASHQRGLPNLALRAPVLAAAAGCGTFGRCFVVLFMTPS